MKPVANFDLCPRCALLRDELDAARAELEAARGQTPGGWRAPVAWGLSRSEEQVVSELVQRPQALLESLHDALYWDKRGEAPHAKIISVFVCKLRKKLSPWGVEIQTLWGRGYALDANTRAQLRDGAARVTPASATAATEGAPS